MKIRPMESMMKIDGAQHGFAARAASLPMCSYLLLVAPIYAVVLNLWQNTYRSAGL